MTTKDIESVVAEWDLERRQREDIESIVVELLAAADAKIADTHTPYDVIAAEFLLETIANAVMLSIPTPSPPAVPKLTICTTAPGVNDSAVTNAVTKVSENIATKSVVKTHYASRIQVNQASVQLVDPSSDKVKIASTLDDVPLTGQFDPATIKFLRPASNAGARKHAMERLGKDARNNRTRNTITQQHSDRKQEILDLLNVNTKGSYAVRKKKIEELPDNLYYVVDSAGKIIGLFKNQPPAQLAQISEMAVKAKNAKVVGTNRNTDLNADLRHLSESEIRSEATSMIKSQINDDVSSIGKSLTTFQKDNVNVLSILVPSQGVIFKGDGKVKKGPIDERVRNGMRGQH
ncbi:hypothetical protein GL50803_0010697 [Giardia duodenalis]|uniref:Uncharacterized protein n=1 Tax=Giardia intestinalis (strain ATCC 50803 / WB clone C6) TaxID=184922 RepID=A8BD36_GIAIC|nr:hypothetical protein GL50803_0010697 [Giardia intestinalis]KAE8304178.1 hypothetical protein GL50803_0010697 [Giardia intestinalis]|eukprot:XP_001707712.1 Hypothetical protein GL50803_10697 [Giardia lamblia ATCC 50803]